jgi:hypothetical protein
MLVMTLAATSACDDSAVQIIAGPPAGGASVKFFNFALSSPNVNFYINDNKITAVNATLCATLTDENRAQCTTAGAEATSGVAYGGAGHGASGWYSDVAPGPIAITGRIATATDKNLPIANLQATVATGKFYSYYMSGIYNATTKTADSFIVEDVLPAVDHSTSYVRFVNAISNGTGPMTLFATPTAAGSAALPVGGSVAYKSGGAFTAVPAGAYNLGTRYDGGTTNVISRTNVTFSAGRVYTITSRGNVTSGPALDFTANR